MTVNSRDRAGDAARKTIDGVRTSPHNAPPPLPAQSRPNRGGKNLNAEIPWRFATMVARQRGA